MFADQRALDYKQDSVISDDVTAPKRSVAREDMMDVDEDEDDNSQDALWIGRRDARTSLHLQVVEHFTFLLVDLVTLVGKNEISDAQKETSISRYAPSWQRNLNRSSIRDWTGLDLLRYLEYKRNKKTSDRREDGSKLGAFLSKPYTPGTGARPGDAWSKEQWLMALREIKSVGDDFGDPAMQESLVWLEPHLGVVFDQKMEI